MNIFMTNESPRIAAFDHCVVHRNKMIIEVSQLLSTADAVEWMHDRAQSALNEAWLRSNSENGPTLMGEPIL